MVKNIFKIFAVAVLALGLAQSVVAQGQASRPSQGGTGNTTYTAGDLLYASTSNPVFLNKLPIGTSGFCLTSNGSAPAWGACGDRSFLTSSGNNTYLNTGTNLQAPFFTATGTSASIFPYASTTALSSTNGWFSGNFSIGTLNLDNPLTVKGSSISSSTVVVRSPTASIVTNNIIGGIDFVSNDNNVLNSTNVNAALRAISETTHTASTLRTGLIFLTTGTSELVGTERARLDGSGNFGIGTTSPGQKLSVGGDILGHTIIGSFFNATSSTATSTFTNVRQKTLNDYTVYADQFAGATAGAKITAATAALPSSGGTVDASNLTGSQTISTAGFTLGFSDGRPVTYIFGPATYNVVVGTTVINFYDNVRIVLNNTTFQPSTAAPSNMGTGLFTNKIFTTTGSITASSNTLTVADATGFSVGKIVAVRGMSNSIVAATHQYTTITDNIDAATTSIPIASNSGFTQVAGEYFKINNEIVTGTISGDYLIDVTRGVLGTTAASHTSGDRFNYTPSLVTEILGVSGTTITLRDAADVTVTSAPVEVGVYNVSFEGTGVMDGRQDRSGPDADNSAGLWIHFSSRVSMGPDIFIKNFDHNGTFLVASWYNNIRASVSGIGRPADGLGFGHLIWGQSKYNYYDVASIFDSGTWGFGIDDRSTKAARYDGCPEYNTIRIGSISATSSSATGFYGFSNQGCSNGTYGTVGKIQVSNTAIILDSIQWTEQPTLNNNTFHFGDVQSSLAVYSTEDSQNNTVYINRRSGAITTLGTSTLVVDNNNFIGRNIGIATSSPYAKLSVSGMGVFDDHIRSSFFIATSSTATSTFAGAVGIGTTSPMEKFTIESSDNSVNGAVIMLSREDTAVTLGDYLGMIKFQSNDTSSGGRTEKARIGAISDISTGNVVGLNFQTSGSGGTIAEIMRITGAGLVGIGTTSPYARLSVTNLGTGPSFVVEDSTSPDLTPFIIDASGNVGIGTTSPFKQLSVSDSLFATYASTTALTVSGALYNSSLSNGCLNVTSGLIGSTGSACGAGGGGGDFSWTSTSNFGQTANATSTQIWLRGYPYSLTASSSVQIDGDFALGPVGSSGFTYASSTASTTISHLEVGALSFEDDAGRVMALDMPIVNAGVGIVQAMDFGQAASSTFTIYGESNGSAGVKNQRIGVGTTTPWRTLDVNGTVGFKNLTTSSSAESGYLCLTSNNEVVNDSTACLVSAKKFKKDIENLDVGLDLVLGMRPVSYKKKNPMGENDAKEQVGFIADEVKDTRLVSYDNEGDVHGFRYDQYTAVLTKAIQELNAKVTTATRTAEENWQWFVIIGLGIWNVVLTIKRKK